MKRGTKMKLSAQERLRVDSVTSVLFPEPLKTKPRPGTRIVITGRLPTELLTDEEKEQLIGVAVVTVPGLSPHAVQFLNPFKGKNYYSWTPLWAARLAREGE